jgi:TolB-like protein
MMSGPSQRGDRLDSWKQIAAYLHRGVRTVRRWEREEGLPIHRHLHRTLGSVYAFTHEIDSWRENSRQGDAPRIPRPHAKITPTTSLSIAVLPFASLGGETDNDYFTHGLTEEITTRLAKLAALHVTSRTSSARLKGTDKNAATIARELRVRYLLEGSVRRAGGRLRVTVQLIEAAVDAHRWSESYNRTVEDIFAIQEQIARKVVHALQLHLTSEEDRRLSEGAIDDPRAYECYLRARHEGWRWRKESIDRAVQLLSDGLATIRDNPRLLAALGLAHLQYRDAGIDFSDRPLIAAEACARKIFQRDTTSSAGLQLRGWINYARANIQDAVRDLRLALDLEPSNADTLLLLSNCYLISGRVAAARPLIERLVSIDPLTPVTRCMPGWADLADGNLAAAIEPYGQMLRLDPASPMARLFYVWVLLLNGRRDEISPIVEGLSADAARTVPGRIALFLRAALATANGDALPAIDGDIEVAARESDVFARTLADAYAIAGFSEPAVRWLEVAVDRGFINYPFLAEVNPMLERLRGEPAFRRLLELVQARWERFEV